MEVPRLEREVWRRYRKRGLVVIGVAIDQKPERVRAFRDLWGLTYPLWVDGGRTLYDRYAEVRLPLYNVLLDQQGRVVTSGPEMYLEDFTAHLARLTASTPAPPGGSIEMGGVR